MRFKDACMKIRETKAYPIILALFPPLYFMEVWLWLTAYRIMIVSIPVIGLFLVPGFPLHARGN